MCFVQPTQSLISMVKIQNSSLTMCERNFIIEISPSKQSCTQLHGHVVIINISARLSLAMSGLQVDQSAVG
jgi:hypothetical protein